MRRAGLPAELDKLRYLVALHPGGGSSGATGATGPNGPSGVAGATGATGAGATGASGPPGASGATGPTGVGANGATGPTGPTGAGAIGATGATGPSGGGAVIQPFSGTNASDVTGLSGSQTTIASSSFTTTATHPVSITVVVNFHNTAASASLNKVFLFIDGVAVGITGEQENSAGELYNQVTVVFSGNVVAGTHPVTISATVTGSSMQIDANGSYIAGVAYGS